MPTDSRLSSFRVETTFLALAYVHPSSRLPHAEGAAAREAPRCRCTSSTSRSDVLRAVLPWLSPAAAPVVGPARFLRRYCVGPLPMRKLGNRSNLASTGAAGRAGRRGGRLSPWHHRLGAREQARKRYPGKSWTRWPSP